MEYAQTALTLADTTERQNLHRLLSEMLITVADKLFQDQNIYIDGYRFINCSFLNCNFHVLRGTFEFHHCVMRGGTRIWGEDAMKSVQFYTLNLAQWQATPQFGAKIHQDGSFSIGKGVTVA
jgi:hypothetical protein